MEMMDISDLPHTDLGPRLSLPPPTFQTLQPAQGEYGVTSSLISRYVRQSYLQTVMLVLVVVVCALLS